MNNNNQEPQKDQYGEIVMNMDTQDAEIFEDKEPNTGY